MPRIYIHIILLLTMVLVDCKEKKKKDGTKNDFFIHVGGLSSGSGSASSESAETNLLFDLTGDFMKQFVFQAASLSPTKSVVCSPLSAVLPLGKLIFGATGRTKDELFKTFGINKMKKVEKHFKKILESMRTLPGVTLAIASRIYVNQDLKLLREFAHKARKVFKSGVETLNMKDPYVVAQITNQWVKSQTEGMIPNIIDHNDVAPNTNLIVANAVHFKGKWKYPFGSVTAGTFSGPAGDRAVSMMHVTNVFNYTESTTLGAKGILIPYEELKAMLLIVLPNSKTGLPLLLNQLRLAPNLLNSMEMKRDLVHLAIPKFTVETEFDLSDLYKKVGLKEIFSANSGFDAIAKIRKGKNGKHKEKERVTENLRLTIGSAKHKAIIEVTEEGTKAAAASVTHLTKASHVEKKKFIADHPFLFFIVAEHQQVFAGTFTAA